MAFIYNAHSFTGCLLFDQMIHDAEAEVEFCKLHIIKATELLSGLRLQLREQQSENTGGQLLILEKIN